MWRRFVIAVCWCSVGCISYSTHLPPRATSRGETVIAASADLLATRRGDDPAVLPSPEVSIRHGIADGVDIGGRLNALGIGADAVIDLFDSGRFSAAFAPGLGFAFTPITNQGEELMLALASVSLLAGADITRGATLILGGRLLAATPVSPTAFSSEFTGERLILTPGGFAGAEIDLGGRFSMLPEIGVAAPYGVREGEARRVAVQGGIGFRVRLGPGS